MSKLKSVLSLSAVLAAGVLFTGCAATQVALEHKDLNVQTKMSATVFLDVEKRSEPTVLLDIKNTSDKDLGVEEIIRSRLTAKGYRVVSNPTEAFYILQVNILQVGKADPSALKESLYAGWGGGVGGALAGAAIGGATRGHSGALYGGAIGGLVGGGAELISGSLVKNVTYSMITDIQIMEKTDVKVTQTINSSLQQGTGTQVQQTSSSVRERNKYQTRIVSTANKVNLKFEEALPVLEEQLAKSIAGIL